jgi:hypothetical protein
MGLGAAAGDQHFTALHYEAAEAAFWIRLAYEGQTRVDGSFTAPSLLFSFDAPDPYAGIRAYVADLKELGYLQAVERAAAPCWWSEPIFCGWGSQCILAGTRGGRPADHATQANYDDFLGALARRGLVPGTVVLDDKWQAEYGTCAADPGKWPDLRGWIGARHAEGRRVLLWWKAWDPEGLPEDLCVRNAAVVRWPPTRRTPPTRPRCAPASGACSPPAATTPTGSRSTSRRARRADRVCAGTASRGGSSCCTACWRSSTTRRSARSPTPWS